MRKRLTVRLTDYELETIRERAGIAKLSMSQYLVKAGIGRHIKPALPDDVRRSIAGWGRNLNQLAYIKNSTGQIETEAINRLKADAQKIVTAISNITR